MLVTAASATSVALSPTQSCAALSGLKRPAAYPVTRHTSVPFVKSTKVSPTRRAVTFVVTSTGKPTAGIVHSASGWPGRPIAAINLVLPGMKKKAGMRLLAAPAMLMMLLNGATAPKGVRSKEISNSSAVMTSFKMRLPRWATRSLMSKVREAGAKPSKRRKDRRRKSSRKASSMRPRASRLSLSVVSCGQTSGSRGLAARRVE
mmetsp:Transcript_49997/g.109145  ORF Transcript_49997/g.109145 Transcript_49997/m.109145 type:complete len:204 (+) Transcript_49997:705-1316(+)